MINEVQEEGEGLAPPFDQRLEGARILDTSPGRIPAEGLQAAVRDLTGVDPLDPDARGMLRFLVVGCHTEERILALSVFLRRVFRCDDVAVAAHLVGSVTKEAHLAVLRHTLPGLGVQVLLDMDETAAFAGLPLDFPGQVPGACAIEPAEVEEELGSDPKRIVELLCMHWTRTHLRPLAGGFSGSLLFLAEGWKDNARTEPMVLKVDAFDQMRRELAGYYQVKDFLGKHVPALGYPVTKGEWIGVGMELAAMEGAPQTEQDTYEDIHNDGDLQHFLLRLDKTLDLLVKRLYSNTIERDHVVPYRDFGLHVEQQANWLEENAGVILGYLEEEEVEDIGVNLKQLLRIFRVVTANQAGLEGDTCLAHGDLNFANVICDEGDNVWFIDWTHCGRAAIELDFAKMENDAKFVMMKSLGLEDFPRLRAFEEYLVNQRVPAAVEAIPETLSFVRWDLRFRMMLETVRRIRKACFSLKQDEDWVVYRVALLRYATHTLSFDARRGRGECSVAQLGHALIGCDQLAFDLVSDLFHLRIRTETAAGYPTRQVITIDEAPWVLDSPDYDPPYHVAAEVLEQSEASGGVDPEDYERILEVLGARPARFRDDHGRPLNPSGRTGIAGRGALPRWGANRSVASVVVRKRDSDGVFEVALGQSTMESRLELPVAAARNEQAFLEIAAIAVREEMGASLDKETGVSVSEGYTYDPRQTDHAWVETEVILFLDDQSSLPDVFSPEGRFEELRWWPLNADTINRVEEGQADHVRAVVRHLAKADQVSDAEAARLLARTG
ncbi:MAG: phosphotransferase [Planctomycetota bacterium]